MRIQIIFYGENWMYSTTEDYSDYKDAFETDEEFYEYVKQGVYFPNSKGRFESRFVENEIESLLQSDFCPPRMYSEDLVKVVVLHLDADWHIAYLNINNIGEAGMCIGEMWKSISENLKEDDLS